jgi:tetratricopeptide (TPR) repeat protein
MLTAMLDKKRRGRRKGILIREGSVRQARAEAKLSLGKVAGDQVSRAAIYLIETGRSRPSQETLELIARKTHKPVEFFLPASEDLSNVSSAQVDLRELERLTAVRDFSKVIEIGIGLLGEQLSQEANALVHFHVGQAHCQLVNPHSALQHLQAARSAFERLGDEWMAVEALDWESTAMGYLEDPQALPLAQEALERCRKLDPKPPATEARILGHIANIYVVTHSWGQAMRYYEAAVQAAGGVKDLLQLAKMHHGLGTVYQRMQQPARARQHFDKALALYSIESDLSAVYRLENDLGELLLRQGQLDSAEKHLRSALTGSNELGIDRWGRGYILANLGEVSLERGNTEEALVYLLEALKVGQALGEKLVISNVHTLLGRIEESSGNQEEADQNFGIAIHILEELEMPDRLRECHVAYAELLNKRGDLRSAAEHWKAGAEIGIFTALSRGNIQEAAAVDIHQRRTTRREHEKEGRTGTHV